MGRQMVFALALFWCVLSVKVVWALNAQEIAARIQQYYEDTRSFAGEFEQEVHWRRGAEVRLSKGKVYFQRPGLMRWEYSWPEKLLIVVDQLNVYVYSPEEKQVMIFPTGRALSPKVTLGFMTGKGNLLKDFVIVSCEKLPSGLVALTLTPRETNPQVARLTLVADPRTGEIKEIWFWDQLGNLTKIRFLNLKRNITLSPELFRFVPPQGTEIIKER